MFQQLEQPAALVQHAHVAIDAEPHCGAGRSPSAYAEHQRRHEAAGKTARSPRTRASACSLILRPVFGASSSGNKIKDTRWRAFWDYALFSGGFVPSLVFGVAFGNILQGVPFRIDGDMRVLYEGSGLFELLNPFGILCGLVSVAMLTTHGAVYLTVKAEDGPVKQRAKAYVQIGALVTVALFIVPGFGRRSG